MESCREYEDVRSWLGFGLIASRSRNYRMTPNLYLTVTDADNHDVRGRISSGVVDEIELSLTDARNLSDYISRSMDDPYTPDQAFWDHNEDRNRCLMAHPVNTKRLEITLKRCVPLQVAEIPGLPVGLKMIASVVLPDARQFAADLLELANLTEEAAR